MTIKVKKNEENPESKEILAEAILRISNSLHKLSDSGLNEKAIIALVHDDTKLSKGDISTVLKSLARLRGWYCRT